MTLHSGVLSQLVEVRQVSRNDGVACTYRGRIDEGTGTATGRYTCRGSESERLDWTAVWAVDSSGRSLPYYAASDWSVFCTPY